MANIQSADKIMMVFQGRMNGQIYLNTFPLVVTAVTGVVAYGDAFDALITKIKTAGQLVPKYMSCCADNYQLENIWLQAVAPVRLRKFTYTSLLGGGAGANSCSGNVAGVITRYGALANRHNIGSLHVPIPTEDGNVANGLIGDPVFTALVALAPLITGFVSTSAPAITYGYSLFQTPVTGLPSPIIGSTVQGTARVMRRRTVGVGK